MIFTQILFGFLPTNICIANLKSDIMYNVNVIASTKAQTMCLHKKEKK